MEDVLAEENGRKASAWKDAEMKTSLVVAVVWVGVLGVCFGEGSKEVAKEELSAEEVLRKFAEARKNMNSFYITFEKHDKYEYRGRLNRKGEMHFRYDSRYDGTDWAERVEEWGDVSSTPVSEGQPKRVFTLWDGEDYYSYYRKEGHGPGRLDMARTSDPGEFPNQYVASLVQDSWPGKVMGYCPGDDQAVNELFTGDTARLRLRKGTENIRGADCQVIDAQIRGRGRYTVWIDPARDYHMTRNEDPPGRRR